MFFFVILLSILLAVVIAVIRAAILAFPVMWITGLLNASGLEVVPALNFWQSAGIILLFGLIIPTSSGSSSKDSERRNYSF